MGAMCSVVSKTPMCVVPPSQWQVCCLLGYFADSLVVFKPAWSSCDNLRIEKQLRRAARFGSCDQAPQKPDIPQQVAGSMTGHPAYR